jgi:hypothetical protein
MRRIPDLIIASGVIVAVAGIATGYRWVGITSLLVALIVGWKRAWCMKSAEAFASNRDEAGSDSSGDSAGGDTGAADGD